MARKKKVEEYKDPSEYSDREVRLSQLRNNRIPHEYLTKLVMDYKFKKSLDKDYPMSRELAEALLIIIDKTLGSPGWRGYTPDWKEEFRGRAIEHVLRYGHNFSPEKCKEGKRNDAYNYFSMIINRAFVQSWKKCKVYSENNIQINHDVIYDEKNWGDSQEFKPENTDMTVMPDFDTLDYGSVSDII